MLLKMNQMNYDDEDKGSDADGQSQHRDRKDYTIKNVYTNSENFCLSIKKKYAIVPSKAQVSDVTTARNNVSNNLNYPRIIMMY